MTDLHEFWLHGLMEELFRPEDHRYIEQINALIDENDKLLGARTEGFNYLGEDYGRDGRRIRVGVVPDNQLMHSMHRIHKLRQAIDFDRKLIGQFLHHMAKPCQSLEELRDVLPECLVSLMPQLAAMGRTRQAAWTLQDSPRDLRQYARVLSRIETYCAMRFLY